ncbi:hypothetical protein [Gemmatimonas sp.]|uniref:hypothetical protein n=1 Tax=Gemmatimonas sp. TaxID=1962908 RepID=UPI0039834576
MVSDHVPERATLAAVLHRYAQHAPPRQFGAEVGIGLVLASVAVWLRPDRWIVLMAVGCGLAMLGTWAWADRAAERAADEKRAATSRAWRFVRAIATVVGASAVMVTAFAGLATMLGTWIS